MRRVKIVEESHLDRLLRSRQARKLKTFTVDTDYVKSNPAFLALSGLEQKAFLMHLLGKINNDIGKELNLKPYQVTRLLQGIKAKLSYLYGFRTLLTQHPDFERKFYNEHDTNDSYRS